MKQQGGEARLVTNAGAIYTPSRFFKSFFPTDHLSRLTPCTRDTLHLEKLSTRTTII